MPFSFVKRVRSSLSAKVALVIFGFVVTMTCSFSIHHYLDHKEALLHYFEAHLINIGEQLIGPAEKLSARGDLAGLQEEVMEEALIADIEYIILVDTTRRVCASSKKEWIGQEFDKLHTGTLTVNDVQAVGRSLGGGHALYYDEQDGLYSLAMPFRYGSAGRGALLVSLNIRSMQADLKKIAGQSILTAVVISFVIGTVIFFVFHRLITKRLHTVAEATNLIATGDLNARVKEGGADEIGVMASSFNTMAEKISAWQVEQDALIASRMNDLLLLFDVVNTVSQSFDLRTVLPNVLGSVLANYQADKGAIVLIEGDGMTLNLLCQQGLSEASCAQITQSGLGCIGDVILTNNAIRAGGEETDSFIPGLGEEGVRSALVVPVSGRGSMLGALAVYRQKPEPFTDEAEALLTTIGNQVSVAVLNARLYQKTLELAQMDGLTGVANKRYLMERMKQEVERTMRYETPLSLVMMDLDKFKSFNDTYGHVKGDELLKAFAALIKKSIRTTDIAGRYGGEEFSIVLTNTPIKGAVVIAERIRKAVEELKIPMDVGQPPVGRTVSIGIAEFIKGGSMEQMITTADAALYRAKNGGRNQVVWQ